MTSQAATGTAARAAIDFERVVFRYPDGVQALGGVSLAVPAGKCVGIVGPSGCGKSTLLSLVAGILQPSSGSINVHTDVSGRHLLTMVFQKDTLLPWLDATQNVNLYYRFHRSRRRESGLRAQELLTMAGLNGFEHSYPHQLSGGMRRRVAFLAAVAPEPQILLLDEPFSSLDEPTRVAIHQDVLQIIRRLGMTVVLVTHDIAEAVTLCDRVVIMTRRPGVIWSEYEIPFGTDRDVLGLRQAPEFLSLYGTLWRDLSQQLRVPAEETTSLA